MANHYKILNCKTTMLNIVMKIPPILNRRVVKSTSKLYANQGWLPQRDSTASVCYKLA